jgi:hypothetical protein
MSEIHMLQKISAADKANLQTRQILGKYSSILRNLAMYDTKSAKKSKRSDIEWRTMLIFFLNTR